MNRREQIRMTADEIRVFLAEQRIASIATTGATATRISSPCGTSP